VWGSSSPRDDGLALAAYETLAPYYDRFTRAYDHASWLRGLERWASVQGLPGRRLLDIACGTGKSFQPMLRLGYVVTACDLSPEMVAKARRRAAGRAHVVVADMRALQWSQEFDLVTCINDAVNYLLTVQDLECALEGMARALVPGGVAIFDANSLLAFRTAFAEHATDEEGDCVFEWEGSTTPTFAPGQIAAARLTVIHSGGACTSWHVQRHWPLPLLRRACRKAGFDQVAFRGQLPGAKLVGAPDELRHPKLVCRASRNPRTRRRFMGRYSRGPERSVTHSAELH
jgi:SAM-dependent methyltransferase